MIQHFIIMSSSYSDGARIAIDFTEDAQIRLMNIAEKIQKECGKDARYSLHSVPTQSKSWESVCAYDPYFQGVRLVQDMDEFIRMIKKDRTLSGFDVALYIQSKVKVTQLALQKLVYLAYADYLCEYSEPLFEDTIYAFKHGPVIDSVYKRYRHKIDLPKTEEMPMKSRILFAESGAKKVASIDQTIEKYGQLSAPQLVALTHKKDAPWSQIDSSKAYQTIPDEAIRKWHYIECE